MTEQDLGAAANLLPALKQDSSEAAILRGTECNEMTEQDLGAAANLLPAQKKICYHIVMLPFKFQNQVIYERLRIFAKDIYSFTGSLPAYEQTGLIQELRRLTTNLLEDFAEGHVRTPKTDPNTSLDHCLVLTAKIAAVIDLCYQLNYTSVQTQTNLINTCDELTKHLYEAKKLL